MSGPSTTAQFRKITLFGRMADHELVAIMAMSTVRQFAKGSELVAVDDSTSDVFFILSGRVQVRKYSQNGRECIYSEISAGGIFGEFSAIDGKPRSASVVTLEDTVIARMTPSKFLSLLQSDFRIALDVLKLLTAKSRALTERLLERSALTLRNRLLAELERLIGTGQRDGPRVRIAPAPTHYELAARLGSHREAITKELNRLELLGYIQVRRRQIVIEDVNRFREDLVWAPPT